MRYAIPGRNGGIAQLSIIKASLVLKFDQNTGELLYIDDHIPR
jgi:hypothetical protein